ncbi:von Willebrand factor type D domain-containing protein [Chytridium lagenaria]|nr:von Willebrand factor type D domain-containing protein [Chytridium lagenaria]KAI8852184.1 von Willebrand factor type D domain-containing protein [Chytridium lagenaria]
MLKTLAFAAALVQVAVAVPSSSSLVARQSSDSNIVFDQKNLVIEDANFGAELSVSLATAPTAAATVYLEAPGLKLSKCALQFNPQNFKTPQKIRVVAGGSDKVTSYTVNAQVFAPNSGAHLAKNAVNLSRKANPSATCYSHGDPHYKTFDGKYFSEQGRGVYYLVKSPSFIVQADQERCGDGVTCNRAVAIQFGKSVVSLAAANSSKTTMALKKVSEQSDGITVTANDARTHYKVQIADGSTVTVAIHPWKSTYYLDISINIAGSYLGKTNGLCGNFNQKADDDGVNLASYKAHYAENIFLTGKGLNLNASVPPLTYTCKIPLLSGALPPTANGVFDPLLPGWSSISIPVPPASVVNDFITASIQYVADNAAEVVSPTRIPAALAAPLCGSLKSLDDWCTKNVDVEYFIGACSADVANTGEMSIVSNFQRSFLTACAAKTSFEADFAKEGADAMMTKVAQLYAGVGDATSKAMMQIQIQAQNPKLEDFAAQVRKKMGGFRRV